MNPSGIVQAVGSFFDAEPLFQRLLFASLELAVLGLAMGVLIRVGRIRSPRLICLLWLVVLVKPLVSLSAGSPVAIVRFNTSLRPAPVVADRTAASAAPGMMGRPEALAAIEADGDDAAARTPLVASGNSTPAPSALVGSAQDEAHPSYFANVSLPRTVLATWFAGVLAFLGAHLLARLRLHRFIQAAQPATEPMASRYRALAEQLHLRRVPGLLVTSSLESPAIVGLLRPTILLPAWLVAEANDRKLDWAMRHELTHWRWLDPLSVFVRDVAVILFWFHPGVWWSGRRFVEAMELACDRAMVRDPSDAVDYAEQLFNILRNLRQQRRPAVAGGLFATRTQVGKRIAALLDSSFARSPQLTVLSALGVVVLAGVALAVGVAVRTGEGGQAPGISTGAERILHFPKDRSLGMLYVLDAGIERKIEDFYYWIDGTEMKWEYLGEAKGAVAVPAAKRVRLMLNDQSGNDLSPLAKLGPGDLYELHLGKTADDKCLPHLAHLTGLEVLEFPRSYPVREEPCRFTTAALKQLETLKSLERLTAPEGIDDTGLAAVADALPRLKALYVNYNRLTDAGLAALPKLRSLEELDIGGGKFTNAGLAPLANLTTLHYLLLWGNAESLGDRVTDDALRQIRKIPALTTLKLPSIITDAGLAHLAGHPTLENLSLYDTKVTDRGLVHFRSMPSLKKLDLGKRNFDRKDPPFTDVAAAHLKEVKSLEHLELPADGVTDAGLADLAELSHLRRLDLSMPSYVDPKNYLKPYTTEGIKALVKVRSLESLFIVGPGVTDAALSHVAQLAELRTLKLLGCSITNEGLAKLAALKSLETLVVSAGSDPNATRVTVSGLNCLNSLPRLSNLNAGGLRRDDPVLNIAGLTRLEYLMLTCAKGSALRDEDLACLANLKQLKWFQIGSINTPQVLTDAGMAHLAGLTALDRLSIGGPGVTDRGLAFLANMRRLDSLNITGNFTDQGVRHLEGLKGLRSLWIYSGSNLSAAAKERLRKKLPNLYNFTADDDRAVGRNIAGPPKAGAATRPVSGTGAAPSKGSASAHPKPGTPAPDFTVTTLEGAKLTLSEQRGRVVFLHFWGTWCSPCTAGLSSLKAFQDELRKKYGDRVVMVNLAMDDTDAKVRDFVEFRKWSGPHARIGLESKLAASYGVTGAPDDFMIGPDGRILLNRESPEKPSDTEAVIEKALKGS